MRNKLISGFFIGLLIFIFPLTVSATFSIVAVDTVTGAVGGAGASCIGGSVMINDLIEGIGAVHTQAYWLAANQANGHARLSEGLTPDSIINWLYWNDVEGTPGYRQYIAVTLNGPGDSYGYTGSQTDLWRGHIYGPGYAIAGNILLGPEIIQDMEFAFLATDGPLEDKLMAALQAANVPGADTRCMNYGKPAISSFIKVIHPGDGDTYYLDLVVNNTISIYNPIDSLQVLYDAWIATRYADAELSTVDINKEFLPTNCPDSALISINVVNNEGQLPIYGIESVEYTINGIAALSALTENGGGAYSGFIYAPVDPENDTVTVTVTANEVATVLNQKAVINFYMIGDVNDSKTINIIDITYLIAYLYKSGQEPSPVESGDVNASETINILDITYLIALLYKSGPEPICP
ncbi:MAG: DUF1028 domain-containing protein [Candidatus Zixiibacteriota bacterium]